jgi:hypothetical protein
MVEGGEKNFKLATWVSVSGIIGIVRLFRAKILKIKITFFLTL